MAHEESVTIKIFVKGQLDPRLVCENRRTRMLEATEEETTEEDASNTLTIFVDTNLDTHFVFETSRTGTFGELKEVLKRYHKLCYPGMGEVGVQNLLVEANLRWYVVVDSTSVKSVFTRRSSFLRMIIMHRMGRGHRGHETGIIAQPSINPNAENRALNHPTDEDAALQIGRSQATELGGNVNDNGPTNLLEVGGRQNDVQISGEPSISNVSYGVAPGGDEHRINIKLQQDEKFVKRSSFFDRTCGGMEYLTQEFLMNTQDSLYSERQESGESGGEQKILTQEPGNNSLLQSKEDTPYDVEATPTVKGSLQNDDAIDPGPRRNSLEESPIMQDDVNLKKTSGALPTSLEPCVVACKCELAKEHASCEGSRGGEKLSVKEYLVDIEGGLLNNDHLSVDVVTTRTHSDMGQKQSTPNRSTDMETDELIESLLSFQMANPLLAEVDKLGSCCQITAPAKETNFLKCTALFGGGSANQMQELKVPSEKLPRQKKKKRRKHLESQYSFEERDGKFQSVDCLGHTADVSHRKTENHRSFWQTDDKQTGKKVKHYHSKRSLEVEVQEGLPKPEKEMCTSAGDKDGDAWGQINLTAGELGTPLACDAGQMVENYLDFIPASLRIKKDKKKHKVVHAARQQNNPSISESPKDLNLKEDGPVALQSGNMGISSKGKGNTPINVSGDNATEKQFISKTKAPNIRKTRLSKKRHTKKVSKTAMNAFSWDDVLPVEDNVSPTTGRSSALQISNPNEKSSEPLERARTGEKRTRSTCPRSRPKVQTPCPAGCGRIYSGRTSAFYQHRKKCKVP